MASTTGLNHRQGYSNKKPSEQVGQYDHNNIATDMETTTSAMQLPPRITYSHLLVIAFGVLLYALRVYNTSLLGHKIGLLWGTVPIECLLWIVTIIELVLRDAWQLWRQTGITIVG